MKRYLKAFLFDLDGVITDTAEYHFKAWKQLADEEGIPFARADNEHLRGVSRRASLTRLLAGRPVTEDEAEEMMARKNGYYQAMLKDISPADLLPGVGDLLAELRAAQVKIAIASASRNSPAVVELLGISDKIDILVHGGHVERQKPAPDLFLLAAEKLRVFPGECVVIEDARAGVEAAHAAGMVAVGIGPTERVGAAELVCPNLDGATYFELARAATWRVTETQFEPENQAQYETVFSLGNGYLGTRGSFEERYPLDKPATLVHGIWDDVPIGFTELANAPDWTSLELWVNGQQLTMSQPGITDYVRSLDLRDGVLRRRLRWSPSHSDVPVEVSFERFASLADEHLLAVRVRITSLQQTAQIRVRAALDSHVENDGTKHWDVVSQESDGDGAELLVCTRHSEKSLALCSRVVAAGADLHRSGTDTPGYPGTEVTTTLPAGQTLVFDKLISIYTAREVAAPLEAARAGATAAAETGYDQALAGSRAAWDEFWEVCDVIIEGDDEAQIATRHSLFQLRIAAPTHDERVSIGARSLTGFGYRGHVFWDNEIFSLPFFTYTQPGLARNMLMYRYHTLPGARRKAAANGYAGAQYAWESAETGDEVTPTWVPDFNDRTRLIRIWTGDIQIHITADILYALRQYWTVTGDDNFWQDVGVPIALETAVFWGERAEPEADKFSIRDIIGPDEYHDHVDNNAFTNYMCRWHLQTALEALNWLQNRNPAQAAILMEKLDLTPDRLAHWGAVIAGLVFDHDLETGLIEQFEGFFQLKQVNWEAHAGIERSMQEVLGIEETNEHQVIKQADVIALLCLFDNRFDQKTWQANWDYYVPITDHIYGSSLGPALHAWAACRMGQPDLAYEHFMRSARADLGDIRGNAGDGIHIASAGGLWQALVFGFAGLRITEEGPISEPQLPAHWERLAFNIVYWGKKISFDYQKSN